MARRNPPAKWVLPNVVDPPRICFQIEVPNDVQHLAAFRGAILNLAAAYKWQDDLAHTAKRVAAVWDDVYTKIRTCDSGDGSDRGVTLEDFMSQQIRISPDNSCIIQMWCIDHWEDWYFGDRCAPGAVAQPSPGGDVPSDECRTFSFVLQGSSRLLLPVPVEAGFTIQISNAQGGWWDGDILHAWGCPDGSIYAGGICAGSGAADAGSPINTLPNSLLIAGINGVYYPAYNTTINVPAGVASSDLYFQMNDAVLTDNEGSVSFDVTVCNAGLVTETVSVPINSSTPTDTVFSTDIDKLYKLTMSGVGAFDAVPRACDAFYLEVTPGNWIRNSTAGTPCGTTDQGIVESCAQFATIPAFDSGHDYVVYKQGTGAPFSFLWADDVYTDNSGTISILVEAT
jgi:hypothetical protein